MNQRDVTKVQAEQVSKALYRPMNYLVRLRKRMERLGFPPDDPLFRLVNAAFEAIHHLSVHVHYMTCTGVWEVPRKDEPVADVPGE